MSAQEYLFPSLLIVAGLYTLACVLWAYRDARQRGRSGLLIAYLVLQLPVLGVVLWLLFRPPLPDDSGPAVDSRDPDADLKTRANAGTL